MVEDYVMSCYNHPAGGDYNTEALIFNMTTARFLMFRKKRKMKMHLLDNHLSNYTKTIILLRLSEYCGIILETSPQYSLRLRRIIVKCEQQCLCPCNYFVFHSKRPKNCKNVLDDFVFGAILLSDLAKIPQ